MAVWCSLIPVVMTAIKIYLYVIVASAIFSWLYAFNIVNPSNHFVATIARALYALTEPVLQPIRRFVPNFGGLDISPVILILILFFAQNLLINVSGCYARF